MSHFLFVLAMTAYNAFTAAFIVFALVFQLGSR